MHKMFKTKLTRWSRLDNAAKIFPATSGKKDARVFRFACELTEEVDPKVLQQALDQTMESFPLFRSVLRKGLFWYYFESSDLEPVVREEYRLPCSNLYVRDQKNLLFEVTYYQKRINFEVFHALTDGTGALHFLRMLVYSYLTIKHKDIFEDNMPLIDYDASHEAQRDDSFQRYYSDEWKKKNKKLKEDIPKYRAFQIKGQKTEYGHMQITEGVMSAKAVLEKAKEYHVTMTVFLTAILLCSIEKEMTVRQRKKPVSLMIPVNLRNYYPSNSARNFFGWIDIGYYFLEQSDRFEDVVLFVKQFFEKELTKERIAIRMHELISLECNPILRIVPLELKTIFLQIGTALSFSAGTAIFSNLGKITMPEELSPYIRLFDVFTSTPKKELSICSYNDNLVLTISSHFESTDIEKNFFRMLSDMGIEIEIAAKRYEV